MNLGSDRQLIKHVSFPRYDKQAGVKRFAREQDRDDGSGSDSQTPGVIVPKNRKTTSAEKAAMTEDQSNAWRRTKAMLDAGRLSSKVQKLSPLTDAVSRIARSLESVATMAISSAIRHATRSTLQSSREFVDPTTERLVIASAGSDGARASTRSREHLGGGRGVSARNGLIAGGRVAASIRAVVTPPNLSRRQFTEPSGNARGANRSGMGGQITINSAPTVVINAPTPGGSVERDVIGVLQAHREELFDQLKRESARRERVQF